ncbi:MAG: hypothetical protein HY509_04160, partial [Acidobacteria bacterium]|nr:hypothetical protein [Acidobacteriota bacterium]
MPDREIVKSKPHYKRSLVLASLFFGVLFAADLALIGYLAYRLLSKEVREKADLETEVAADQIAAKVQEILDRLD